MPKVRFIKSWRHFEPNDTLVADDKLAKWLYSKGVIVKPSLPRKKPAAKPATKK
jgi:hypothetical protein